MARFTTRVELHGAQEDHYVILHEEMENEGFRRYVIDTNSIKYALPTAEYDKEGDYKVSEVKNSANKAAKKTGKSFSILVTKSDGSRDWENLNRWDDR